MKVNTCNNIVTKMKKACAIQIKAKQQQQNCTHLNWNLYVRCWSLGENENYVQSPLYCSAVSLTELAEIPIDGLIRRAIRSSVGEV